MTHYRNESDAGRSGRGAWAMRLGAALVAVALMAAPMVAQDAKKVTLEDIRKAWQQRQDKVKSARIVYNETTTITKGISEAHLKRLALRMRMIEGKDKNSAATSQPPVNDVSFDARSSLLLDGSKVFWSSDTLQMSATTGVYGPAPQVASYDGKTQTWMQKGSPNNPAFQAHVTPATKSLRLRVPTLIPLVMTYRPFVGDLRILNLDAFTMTGRRDIVSGKSCFELTNSAGPAGTRFWVDPSRDCIILRVLTTASNKFVQKIDIRYRSNPIVGWVTDGWEMLYWQGKDELQEKWVGTVTSCEINMPIEAREFEIEFPAGTLVNDEVKKQQYLVKPTGSKRLIPPEDLSATYEQLKNSEPGEALSGPPHWRWRRWAVGLAGCSVAGMGFWWLTRRRRRATSSPGEATVPRGA